MTALPTMSVGHSGIFKQNHAYSGIIQGYSGTFRSLCNLGIFRNLVYSESEPYSEHWYIQDLKHIHNPVKHLQWRIL